MSQCKDNINKYIQLNQFGARFNMYAMYVQMTNIETSALTGISDVKKQQLENQRNIKDHYEKQFHKIIQNMGNVIKDFLKFQVDFKKQYFGWNIAQKQNTKYTQKQVPSVKNSIIGKLSSSNSIKSGDSKFKKSLIQTVEDQQKQSQLQQKLRQILKRKLAPQKQNIIKFCDKQSDPYKNMLKLEQKIDMMQSQIILSRNREEKIIDIFNKRRIENIQPKGQNLIHCELIQANNGTSLHKGKDNKSNNQSNYQQHDKKALENQIFIQNSSSKKKLKSQLSMNIEAINSSKNIRDLNCKNQNQIEKNQSQISRKLISPKGLKSPLERSNGNKLHFFGSPKNLMSRSKATGIQFKKKRQPQDQETQSTMQQQNPIIFKEQQHNRTHQMQNQEKVNIENININHNPNKNRDKFLSKRKSNNQPFHIGASSLIE